MLQQLFRNQYSSTITCALALLLFFLPFVELKCKKVEGHSNDAAFFQNDLPPATMTGFGMMTGRAQTKIALPGAENMVRPQWLIAVAFFSGLIAFVFSLVDFKGRSIWVVATSTLAAICLIIVRFRFQSSLNPGLHLQHVNPGERVEISFKIWYYFSLICFVATSLFAYEYGLLSITDRFEFEEERN